jgi:predicted Zn-dependent protease
MKREPQKLLISVLILSIMIGLTSCSVNPATGDRSFTGFMSLEDEIKIGREEHPKILKSFNGPYKDAAVTAYVTKIGLILAAKSELPNIKWTFTVLNSPQINAFALPGGYVYVTRGLMALASSEAELAGVIAHEIGHVTGRHTAQRYSSSILVGSLSTAAGIFLGSAASDIANFAGHAAVTSYSRKQEFEADTLGVRYLSRSDYTNKSMASFLAKLRAHSQLEAKRHKKNPKKVDQGGMFATHPRTIDRVKRAIADAKGTKSGSRRGTVDYMGRLHNLVYGDDPKEGLIKGRSFIHPGMKFRFDVPEGFRLFNGPNAVLAKGPDGAIIQFDIAKKPYSGSITSYISNVWAREASFTQVDSVNVNGMEGATAKTRLSKNNGAFDLRFIAIRQNKERIYRFSFFTKAHQTERLSLALRKTTFSLRSMSNTEAQTVQPSRILVKPVRPGDTVKYFVQHMGISDFKEETFRVINGLRPSEKLRLGRLVKVISD